MNVYIQRYLRLSWPAGKDNPKKKRHIYVATTEDGRTGVGQTAKGAVATLHHPYTEEQLLDFRAWMAEKWGK